jgi:two-component system, cell cycle sensor histidine kinase and response regulator CckA
MDMIRTLKEFNRCRKLPDFKQLIANWAQPSEALAFYIADPSGRGLTLMPVHDEALNTLERTVSFGEHPAWQSIQSKKTLTDGEHQLLPFLGDEHPDGCIIVRGEALSAKVTALQDVLIDTLFRCIEADRDKWMCQILDGLGRVSRDSMIVATMNGDLVFYSAQLEKTVGWSEQEVREQGWTNLVYPDAAYRMEVMKGLAALLHGKASNGVVRRITCKDGQVLDMAIWSALGASLHGGPPALLGVLTDVTKKQATERVENRAKSLERLGKLSGIIAHDFNNLLCAIMGHAELLELQSTSGSTIHQRAMTILNACNRGAALTRQLLTFGGSTNCVLQTVDAGREVAALVELFQADLPQGLKLHLDVSPDVANIEADPALLANAIMNLLVNARDSTPTPGDIRVKVRTLPLPATLVYRSDGAPEADTLCTSITVQDSGDGFSNDALEHLFEPFFSTKQMGHGLGLSSIVGVLDTHAGAISIENSGGAVVKLFFHQSDKPEFMLDELVGQSNGTGQTVWMVDDDTHVLEFATLSLTAAGFNVRTFVTGHEVCQTATDLNQQGEPSLVVLDVLGDPTGPQTLTALRSIGIKSPVLWVSGFTPERVAKEATIGPHNFLQKPFTGTELVNCVSHMVSRTATKQETPT